MTNQEIVEMVTAKAGGESALARALGIKVQSVQKWKKIPAERVLVVEHVTDISREKTKARTSSQSLKECLPSSRSKGRDRQAARKKVNRASGKGGRLPSRERSQRAGNALLGLIRTVALRLQHRQQGIQRDGCEAGVGQPR